MVPLHPKIPEVWMNHTKWIKGSSFQFTELHPHTEYNITVYVRVANTTNVFLPALYVSTMTNEGCKHHNLICSFDN